jgi:hypothetical protein
MNDQAIKFKHQQGTARMPSYEQMHKETEKEPLAKLLRKERKLWFDSWEGSYNAKEEGQHIKRLQAYVQAAADRAAGQLQQQPGLVEKLQRVLL